MILKDKYFELCYTHRIHEFFKIDKYKGFPDGLAKEKFKSIDEFYRDELKINNEILIDLRKEFEDFNILYSRYFNEQRLELFSDAYRFLVWYNKQEGACNYCKISQIDLLKIVEKRKGTLTLNQKTKRSKGTLEIEKLDPNKGYTFDNSVLACPFCNNAKSNLISENDWRTFFVPAIQHYFKNILDD